MKYKEVEGVLKTGDILLFRAGTSSAGKAVGVISGSPFSHVAMIVRFTVGGEEKVCMWESGRDDFPDVIKHKKLAGVHLVVLEDLLYDYTAVWDGDFVLRRLNSALTAAQEAELIEWMKTVAGTPFPTLTQLVFDQVESRFNPTKLNRATYSCAELIAESYQRISLLSISKPSESYAAADFTVAGNLPFQFGFGLLEEQLIRYERTQSVPGPAHAASGPSRVDSHADAPVDSGENLRVDDAEGFRTDVHSATFTARIINEAPSSQGLTNESFPSF